MICPFCQSQTEENARFCTTCGNVLPKPQPAVVPPPQPVVPHPSYPVKCPRCGAQGDSAAGFCMFCNAPLAGAAPINNTQPEPRRKKKHKPDNDYIAEDYVPVQPRGGKGILVFLVVLALLICGGGGLYLFQDQLIRQSDKSASTSHSSRRDRDEKEEKEEKTTSADEESEREDYIIQAESSPEETEPVMTTAYTPSESAVMTTMAVPVTTTAAATTAAAVETVPATTAAMTTVAETQPQYPSGASDADIAFLSATSQLADEVTSSKTYQYSPWNLFDGDMTTCWAEGVDGFGEGQMVTIQFDGIRHISGITLYNGLNTSQRLFEANGRIKDMTVILSDGTSCSVTLSDGWENRISDISFPEPVDTASLTIVIDSVYPGSYTDTCISEIGFF